MAQTFFICGLYLLGFCFGLLFRKRIPFSFICLTGFLWGCTLYVVETILLTVFGIQYTLASIAGLSGLVLIILIIVNFLQGNWRFQPGEAGWLAGSILAFFLGSITTDLFNLASGSIDSFNQIMVGRELAFDGFSSGVINYLSLTGPFMLVLHSAGVLIGSEYLYALLPSFGLSLFMVFIFITYRSIGGNSQSRFFALMLALLAALFLFTSNLFLFQSFYIHTNFPSAVYLFVAVGTCWLSIKEDNKGWLAFMIPALISFSLMRTETILFAVFILFLALSLFSLSARVRWLFTLPYLGVMLSWYILFYARFLRNTNVLSPVRIILLIVLLVGIGIYTFTLRYQKLEQFVHSIVFYAVSGGAILLPVGMLVLKPHNTIVSFTVTLQNMLVSGHWGAFWFTVLLGLILAFTQPRFENEKFFVFILGIYFIFLVALGSIRTRPYHLGRFDSGNRMLTHILPLAVYYLVIKYAPGFMGQVSRFKTWFAEYKASGYQLKP